jgi:phage terminase large subunit
VASRNAVVILNDAGEEVVLYEPETNERCNQLAFHHSNTPNLLALGTRGTGKSTVLRWDAIMRCLSFPNFRALILRRKIPELRTSHLAFIDQEMFNLGGEKKGFQYLSTVMEAKFPNGSVLKFSHCYDDRTEVLTQRGFIYFRDLQSEDTIASLNEQTKQMTFDRPLRHRSAGFRATPSASSRSRLTCW